MMIIQIDIKSRARFYFDGRLKIEDFDFCDILLDKKLYQNPLIYGISYKTLISTKTFRIRFDKVDVLIRVYDGTRYLVLFGSEKI